MSWVPEEFTEFANYIADHYIEESSTFPPSLWASSSLETTRTTNACESFHSKWKTMFASPHPNIHVFVENLLLKQEEVYVYMQSVHNEPIQEDQRDYKKYVSYLRRNRTKYEKGEISRVDYLKKVSSHCRKNKKSKK